MIVRKIGFTALGALALGLAAGSAQAAKVWVIDDGEKVGRDEISLPFREGRDNPIWQPGQPVRLFALQNETVSLQVIVQGEDEPLQGVTVDLRALDGPGGASIANDPGATDPGQFTGRWIERFVEHYFEITRHSATGYDPTLSLGWDSGSGPASDRYTGWIPDALIPVEIAPSWAPYPLQVPARQNRAVWIDITVPRDQAPGKYQGQIEVRRQATELSTLPVDLTIVGRVLPDFPVSTMLYFGQFLEEKMGEADAPATRKHLMQLLHRHRISPMQTAYSIETTEEALPALQGKLYARDAGYEGPGQDVPDGNLVLGPYGGLGEPAQNREKLGQIADLLAQQGLFATTDVLVYAVDESCKHPITQEWKTALKDWSSSNPNIGHIQVGVTCSEKPAEESADIVMVSAQAFEPSLQAPGKKFWIYNGRQPYTGTFLTDIEAVSIRVNGWIAGMHDVGRWFYWHSTFWRDGNDGGRGAFDPFVTTETFHNPYADWCAGDGVLLYPGQQQDAFSAHSLGFAGVLSSIRLKNWRRGIEDAGYLQLARAMDDSGAMAVAKRLVPQVLTSASALSGSAPGWSASGKAFFEARRELLLILAQGLPGGDFPADDPAQSTAGEEQGLGLGGFYGCGCAHMAAVGGSRSSVSADFAGLMLFILALIVYRKRHS